MCHTFVSLTSEVYRKCKRPSSIQKSHTRLMGKKTWRSRQRKTIYIMHTPKVRWREAGVAILATKATPRFIHYFERVPSVDEILNDIYIHGIGATRCRRLSTMRRYSFPIYVFNNANSNIEGAIRFPTRTQHVLTGRTD